MNLKLRERFLLLFSIIFLFLLSGCLPKQKMVEESREGVEKNSKIKMQNSKLGKISFVIAPVNFRDEEYQKPKAVLENAGYQVVTASKEVSVAKGMLGATVNVDLDLTQVNIVDYVAVVFIGGSGAAVYFDDLEVRRIAKEAVQQGKVVGAICIAPTILANAGLLAGKNATCFASEMDNLLSKGAKYTGKHVTVDGKIVTANGPDAAQEFGGKIVEVLGSL